MLHSEELHLLFCPWWAARSHLAGIVVLIILLPTPRASAMTMHLTICPIWVILLMDPSAWGLAPNELWENPWHFAWYEVHALFILQSLNILINVFLPRQKEKSVFYMDSSRLGASSISPIIGFVSVLKLSLLSLLCRSWTIGGTRTCLCLWWDWLVWSSGSLQYIYRPWVVPPKLCPNELVPKLVLMAIGRYQVHCRSVKTEKDNGFFSRVDVASVAATNSCGGSYKRYDSVCNFPPRTSCGSSSSSGWWFRKRTFNETGTHASWQLYSSSLFSPWTILPHVKEKQGIADMVDALEASPFLITRWNTSDHVWRMHHGSPS